MNQLTFPGLGLEFNISKIAFSIFGVNVAWYAVLIVASFIIALAIYKRRDGLYGIKFETILELCIYVIPIAFICARAYYVLFRLDYFLQNPAQILNIKQGRTCNIWRSNRWRYNMLFLCEDEKNIIP